MSREEGGPGRHQTRGSFWGKITDRSQNSNPPEVVNKRGEPTGDTRDIDSLKGRFNRMNPFINRYMTFEVTAFVASGENMANTLDKAHKLYIARHVPKSFEFDEEYKLLKDNPKWKLDNKGNKNQANVRSG